MGWLAEMVKYRDERLELVQLRYAIEDSFARFSEQTAGLRKRSDEYQKLLAEYSHFGDDTYAQISRIETAQAMRRARHWRVPVPQQPLGEDQESETWEWHSAHGRYYLTDTAISRLRREAYQEWEMWSKPWLSWGAILISVTSLVISVLRS